MSRERNLRPHALRIQRRRTKGYRMPTGAVYVGRPTMWGNPFETAEQFRSVLLKIESGNVYEAGPCSAEELVKMIVIARYIDRLRGKQIACWCSLDKPCHADALAEVANRPASQWRPGTGRS